MLLKLKTWEKSLIAPSLLLTISISQIHALVSYHHCLCFRADPCHFLPALLKALSCLLRFCTFNFISIQCILHTEARESFQTTNRGIWLPTFKSVNDFPELPRWNPDTAAWSNALHGLADIFILSSDCCFPFAQNMPCDLKPPGQ